MKRMRQVGHVSGRVEKELCTWFRLESFKERDSLEERGLSGRLILKWGLRK
jgi:hypothetical protein